MKVTFEQVIGGAMALIAVVAIAYASIGQSNEAAMTALVGVAGAAAGFFLRGKLSPPTP